MTYRPTKICLYRRLKYLSIAIISLELHLVTFNSIQQREAPGLLLILRPTEVCTTSPVIIVLHSKITRYLDE